MVVVVVLAVVVVVASPDSVSVEEDADARPRREKEPLRETWTVEDRRPLSFFRCPIARKLPFSSISTVKNPPNSVLSSLLVFISHLPVFGVEGQGGRNEDRANEQLRTRGGRKRWVGGRKWD